MRYESMIAAIGGTPLVRLRVPAAPTVQVYAKLELQNPFAMKDRVARNALLEARRVGALKPGAPIVESSSGTMALGVALVGRGLGHPVQIVTDPRIDPTTLAKLRALGCEVHVVETMTANGWQGARLEKLAALMEQSPGAFWPRQYSNPDNPGAYRELAGELTADLGGVDVLVGSVGSGGSLTGTARALRQTAPNLHVVGIDCVGSMLFDQPDEPRRLQSGIGNSLPPNNLDRHIIDEVHWLNDREAFAATRALAAEQQIFGGNTSGSVYRVLTDVALRAEPGSRIVGIMPDRGDRYAGTVYSDEHWAEHDLTELELATAPEPVDYGTPVRRWSRAVMKLDEDRPSTLLFVESNTTGSGMAALEVARAMGMRPVLITSDPGRYQGLSETGARTLVCDTGSLPTVRETVQEQFRREELAGVVTTSEFYVALVAELAGWLGLPGNPVDAITVCRDKSALRSLLAEVGTPQPRFAAVRTVDEVAAAVAAVGLPCVVKPADDSGSHNVLLCSTVEQVRTQVRTVLAVTENVRGQAMAGVALVEEYLDGPEYSVEMFSWEGDAHCVGITAKTLGAPPHFVEHRHLFPAPLPTERYDALLTAVRTALAAAGVRSGATHTEVRLTSSGPAIVEINPRPAGGMIPEAIRLATGLDLLRLQLGAAVGHAPDLSAEDRGTAGVQFLTADREGVLAAVEGVAEALAVPGVERVVVTARPGQPTRSPRHSYDRLGYIIARTDTPAGTASALDAALARCRVLLEGQTP
ncbi:pyridoxal-phosphate dependent enzyme [Streptomyces anulatus]|uniref:pyridoxal-phosphate dependent enzyme n=1 Tax=Streptomyces TaxID=1883 RepID=UPI001B383AF2|nr:pyridoxal-phosphate dependent enzyme [Streptomyces sp. C3-3]MBQ1114815.1 ATP-grasp domain-containing protein [Streptomyces sp. C3-3]